jgi:hypothetical protein
LTAPERYRFRVTHHSVDPVDPRNRTIAADEPIQLIVHPALRPALFAWLRACGLDVGYAPFLTGEDDLPIFLTTPAHMPGDDPVVSP